MRANNTETQFVQSLVLGSVELYIRNLFGHIRFS